MATSQLLHAHALSAKSPQTRSIAVGASNSDLEGVQVAAEAHRPGTPR